MEGKKYNWFRIASSAEELPLTDSGGLCEIHVNSKSVCLAKYNDKIFAFPAKCPHAGGYLSNGYIDVQGNIVCPLHRYKFNMTNGRNVSGEGYYLKIYPVEIRADGIYIGFEKGWFNV
ncbi:Rieske (2Fe-2S) protein [Pollutibacter soli]|uniref:Rieske (2Fe-2S) protein n=1 Tax=Pollutibacter soli TaxID=3034157 RepID=UPI003013B78C